MKKRKKVNEIIINIIMIIILLISLSYLYKAFTYKSIEVDGINKYMSNIIYLFISLIFMLLSATILIYKQIKNIKLKRTYRKTQ